LLAAPEPDDLHADLVQEYRLRPDVVDGDPTGLLERVRRVGLVRLDLGVEAKVIRGSFDLRRLRRLHGVHDLRHAALFPRVVQVQVDGPDKDPLLTLHLLSLHH